MALHKGAPHSATMGNEQSRADTDFEDNDEDLGSMLTDT